MGYVVYDPARPRYCSLQLSCLGVCYSSFENFASLGKLGFSLGSLVVFPLLTSLNPKILWKSSIPHSCEVSLRHCGLQPLVNQGVLRGNCEFLPTWKFCSPVVPLSNWPISHCPKSLNPEFSHYPVNPNQFHVSTMSRFFKSSLSIDGFYIE